MSAAWQHPGDLGARSGDILHVRSRTFYGRVIRRALGSWGNHDAILRMVPSGAEYADEAVSRGYVATPWAEYARGLERGRCAVLIVRPVGATPWAGMAAADSSYAMTLSEPEYDWIGVLSCGFQAALRLNCDGQSEWRWYCTEAVRAHWSSVGGDVWHKRLPTPQTTAKRIQSGRLALVAAMIPTNMPPFEV